MPNPPLPHAPPHRGADIFPEIGDEPKKNPQDSITQVAATNVLRQSLITKLPTVSHGEGHRCIGQLPRGMPQPQVVEWAWEELPSAGFSAFTAQIDNRRVVFSEPQVGQGTVALLSAMDLAR